MTSTTLSRTGYVAAAVSATLGMGAFGLVDSLAANVAWLQPITSFSQVRASNTKSNKRVISPREMVSELRADGLPVATIADVVKVERKSVYAWLADGAVRPHNQERLEQVFALLTHGKLADLRHLYRFWNRVTGEGESLANLFKADKLDVVRIERVLAEIWPLADKQQQLAHASTKSELKANPIFSDSREVVISYGV